MDAGSSGHPGGDMKVRWKKSQVTADAPDEPLSLYSKYDKLFFEKS